MSDRSEAKSQRARKRHRNLVAKHAPRYNRAATYRDRTKYNRVKHRVIPLPEANEP